MKQYSHFHFIAGAYRSYTQQPATTSYDAGATGATEEKPKPPLPFEVYLAEGIALQHSQLFSKAIESFSKVDFVGYI